MIFGALAKTGQLGRVTLYGHFKSRQALIEMVVRQVLDAANESLDDVDLSGDAASALERLVDATWIVTARSGRLLVAAEQALPPTAIRDAHNGGLEERVRHFFDAAQRTGEFRSDMATDWLVAVFHAVVHVAATEVDAGRLDRESAPGVITKTMLATLVPAPHDRTNSPSQ